MNYLTLDEIKKQCIIEEDFYEDDAYLELLGEAVEQAVDNHIDHHLQDIVVKNGGDLPKPIKMSMLLMADYLYENRATAETEIPNAFYVMLQPYIHYPIA